jgi:hypothetical protein
MIKILVMVECNLCHATLPRALSLTNRTDIPRKKLHDLLIDAEQNSWQSMHVSTEHICADCCHSTSEGLDSARAFVPF